MTLQVKNKLRAIALLIVFSLNTVAGFACSVGLDMGYNSNHHKGQKQSQGVAHKHRQLHKHNDIHLQKHICGAKMQAPNSDCCSSLVNSFTKLDKSIPYNNLLLKAPAFLTNTNIISFFSDQNEPGPGVNSKFQFVRRWCFPDHTDLRIKIQSFQI